MMVKQYELQRDILRKLLHHRLIGEKHTSIDNVAKGFPKHIRGEIRKATLTLVRKGYLVAKPTSHGLEISVHPGCLAQIKEMIFNNGDKES